MIELPKILASPELPPNLSSSAKWLAGEGAGSWFEFIRLENDISYRITRYSPKGSIECEGLFIANSDVDHNFEFQITYPSNCSIVCIFQKSRKIYFYTKDE